MSEPDGSATATAEPIENVDTGGAPESPPSMDDTIQQTLKEIKGRENGEAPPEEKPADPPPAEEGTETPAEPAEGEKPAEGKGEQTEKAETAEPAFKAPNSWRKEAVDALGKLTPEQKPILEAILAEAEKRESDFHNGIETYKKSSEFGESINKVLAPYNGYLESLGATPEQAINYLVSSEYQMRNGTPEQKIAMFKKMATDYGIDISKEGGLMETSPDDKYLGLKQQLDQTNRSVADLNNARNQEGQATAQQQVDDFAKNPKNEHYEAVRDDMAGLLQSGASKSLQDAYDLACYRNPEIKAKLDAKQRTDATDELKKNTKEKVEQAKKSKGTDVKTTKVSKQQKPKTMDETIKATLADIKSR